MRREIERNYKNISMHAMRVQMVMEMKKNEMNGDGNEENDRKKEHSLLFAFIL